MKIKEWLKNIKNDLNEIQEIRAKTPKVRFKSIKLEAYIGNWMRIIPFSKVTRIYKISNQELTKVELNFGRLLKEIGINEQETCIIFPISKYYESNLTFNCILESTGQSIEITLRPGDCIDFSPEMIISIPNGSVCYEYFANLEPKLYLSRKALQNSDNTYYRDLNSYFARYKLNKQKDFSLEIEVERPNGTELKVPNGYILNNESELETYLLNLKKDADPIDVFDNFCEICFKDEPIEEIKRQRITLEFTPYSDRNYPYICKITLIDGCVQVFLDDNGQILTVSSNYANRKELKKN